jgi:hypothetical protein
MRRSPEQLPGAQFDSTGHGMSASIVVVGAQVVINADRGAWRAHARHSRTIRTDFILEEGRA